MISYKQSIATKLDFQLDSTGISTGTISVYLRKGASSFALGAGAITEIDHGLYSYAASAADMNTLGQITLAPVIGGETKDLMFYEVVSHTRADIVTAIQAVPASVWAVGTRTLTSFGTLVTSIWGNATRTLSAFSFTVNTNANATETAIKAKTDLLPAAPASTGDCQTGAAAALTAYDPPTRTEATADKAEIIAQGDSAWTTGAGGSSPTVGEIRAEIDSNSTQLAAIKSSTDNLPTTPAAQADCQTGAAAALTAYDPPTRAEATADKAEIIAQGDSAWTTGAGGSSPTVEAIRAEIDSNSTQLASIKGKTDNLPADPAGTSDVPTVTDIRAELAVELARIDAAISSRNATPPDNATISAIAAAISNLNDLDAAEIRTELAVELARIDAAISSVGGGGGGSGLSSATIEALEAAEQILLAEIYVPSPNPSVILPDPSPDDDLCTVFVDIERGDGVPAAGLNVVFRLLGDLPQKTTQEKLVTNAQIQAVADEDGRVTVTMEKGLSWKMEARSVFGTTGLEFTVPDEETYYLNALVV